MTRPFTAAAGGLDRIGTKGNRVLSEVNKLLSRSVTTQDRVDMKVINAMIPDLIEAIVSGENKLPIAKDEKGNRYILAPHKEIDEYIGTDDLFNRLDIKELYISKNDLKKLENFLKYESITLAKDDESFKSLFEELDKKSKDGVANKLTYPEFLGLKSVIVEDGGVKKSKIGAFHVHGESQGKSLEHDDNASIKALMILLAAHALKKLDIQG